VLREVLNVQQVAGEPPRRWFFSHQQDLWVWFGEDGVPVAFQLAYGKYRDERAIRWKAGRGFALEISAEVPGEIVEFVVARLREHPG
jgi:hypothetical protein